MKVTCHSSGLSEEDKARLEAIIAPKESGTARVTVTFVDNGEAKRRGKTVKCATMCGAENGIGYVRNRIVENGKIGFSIQYIRDHLGETS